MISTYSTSGMSEFACSDWADLLDIILAMVQGIHSASRLVPIESSYHLTIYMAFPQRQMKTPYHMQ